MTIAHAADRLAAAVAEGERRVLLVPDVLQRFRTVSIGLGWCGPPWLAHAASHQGVVAADHIAGRAKHGIDRTNIPSCTYCHPQVASVGLTEEDAVKAGYKVKVGRFPFRPLGKAMAIGESEGTVKLVFDERYGELLGAHIIGPEATEMIAELGMAKALETTYSEILHTMHAHPTLSEAVMEAAGQAFNEAIHI